MYTDRFIKPTDSHRYLNYTSYHPMHVFRSIVYSQALRYRRIINNDQLLLFRLKELSTYFYKCGYPKALVDSIIADVSKKPQSIDYVSKPNENKFLSTWVSTFGQGSSELKSYAHKANKILTELPMFKNEQQKIIQPVFRKGPSLKNMLFKQRDLVLNKGKGSPTARCKIEGVRHVGRPCDACNMMGNVSSLVIKGKTLHLAGGDCKTKNCIYVAECPECKKYYFGKTTQRLNKRIAGHRNKINGIESETEFDDFNSLAAHAFFDHDITSVEGFNSLYKFSIANQLHNPSNLLVSEQSFINKYETFFPYGLNIANPIGLRAILIV